MKKLFSFLLNLIFPGLGFIYLKQYKKAIFFFISFILIFILGKYILFQSFIGFVFILALVLTFLALIVLSTIKINKEGLEDIKRKRTVIFIVIYIIIILFIPLETISRIGYYKPFKLESDHMMKTLEKGDLLIVSTKKNDIESVKRGDIIAYNINNTIYISRLIGNNEDKIKIEKNVVFINGITYRTGNEYFDERINPIFDGLSEMSKRQLKKEEIFVLGDNRFNSMDSRLKDPMFKNQIYGKALYIYLSKSINKIGNDL